MREQTNLRLLNRLIGTGFALTLIALVVMPLGLTALILWVILISYLFICIIYNSNSSRANM